MPNEPGERLATKRLYAGRRIALDIDTVRSPAGVTLELELVRHPGAAAIVPLLSAPDAPDPQVLLIRQ
jgi:ADP-ribose diphosphatase